MNPANALRDGHDSRPSSCARWHHHHGCRAALCGFVLGLACPTEGRAQDATELQAQIERQRAENKALKDRIEQFERVLKTDVCKNPEAAKLLDEEPPAAPPPEPATPQSK